MTDILGGLVVGVAVLALSTVSGLGLGHLLLTKLSQSLLSRRRH